MKTSHSRVDSSMNMATLTIIYQIIASSHWPKPRYRRRWRIQRHSPNFGVEEELLDMVLRYNREEHQKGVSQILVTYLTPLVRVKRSKTLAIRRISKNPILAWRFPRGWNGWVKMIRRKQCRNRGLRIWIYKR